MLLQAAHLEPENRWAGARRFLPAAALAGACAVAALSPAGDDEGQILCPYRLATGGWCPGCGGTRAVGSLVRIDPIGALAMNPWAVLVVSQLVVLTGWLAAAPTRMRSFWDVHGERVLIANLVVGIAIWGVRVALGVIPAF